MYIYIYIHIYIYIYAFIQYTFNTKRFDVLLNNFQYFLVFKNFEHFKMKKVLEIDATSVTTFCK